MKPSELKEDDFIQLVTTGGTLIQFHREYGQLQMVVGPTPPETKDLTNEEYFIPGIPRLSELAIAQEKVIDDWEDKRVWVTFGDWEHMPNEEAADKIWYGLAQWLKEPMP